MSSFSHLSHIGRTENTQHTLVPVTSRHQRNQSAYDAQDRSSVVEQELTYTPLIIKQIVRNEDWIPRLSTATE